MKQFVHAAMKMKLFLFVGCIYLCFGLGSLQNHKSNCEKQLRQLQEKIHQIDVQVQGQREYLKEVELFVFIYFEAEFLF